MPNTSELASTAAARDPEGLALVDAATGRSMTWADFDGAVSAEAARLAGVGLQQGDRVAVCLPSSIDCAVAMLGAVRAGGIVVPASPHEPDEDLRRILEHSGSRFLISGRTDGDVPVERVLEPPAARPGADTVATATPVGSGEDIALLCYTTAARGQARGVMLSHRALLANVEQMAAIDPAPVTAIDRVLVAVPLFHVYGFGPGLLQCIRAGATAVIADHTDGRAALAACTQHHVSVVLGVPAMYAELAALPADELRSGLASVRLLISGAAALRPNVLTAIEQATGLGVYDGYGLTQAAPMLASTLVTGRPKPNSVGRALPGVELRLVSDAPTPDDEADEVLADLSDTDGDTGMVAVRGPNLFSGYWPDGVGGPDDDGWFQTADIGYLDADGDLHLVDRVDDTIVVSGFPVYPHEVEEVVAELPQVAEVAVVGVLDDHTGEAVKAVVVPGPGSTLSEQQVIEHCAQKLPRYKVPIAVEFSGQLPHTVTGKLYRTKLR
ncbi:AMP-binding protein [Thermocrispum sp.]|uniref:AMP-binding protein n=1 Tax=Thermocrispum agreste TaxID=37925 RepID=A0ABD6FGK9_9PSEU